MKGAAMLAAVVVSGMLLALPLVANTSQHPIQHDLTDQAAVVEAVVEFGHPTILTGMPVSHVVLPEEVTVSKGGRVTFRMNGPGHGIAIYPVSKNTTRQDIAQYLCDGAPDCSATHARTIRDGKGDIVIEVE